MYHNMSTSGVYPMQNVEELIDKLGWTEFITAGSNPIGPNLVTPIDLKWRKMDKKYCNLNIIFKICMRISSLLTFT